MMDEEFKGEVIRALERRGLTEVRYVERARNRRCTNDSCEKNGSRLEKFRGFKNGAHMVAYACSHCRHVYMKSLAFLKPIPVEL